MENRNYGYNGGSDSKKGYQPVEQGGYQPSGSNERGYQPVGGNSQSSTSNIKPAGGGTGEKE